ncbi:HIT family protein [Actinocorallia sp. B10E7]|uniref:HIT family protein n=1 Tax=Actinocorallia sp. B10E7 TaxID=3153558 RepID=UPI00325DB584
MTEAEAAAPSLFSLIIAGRIPARFVWQDPDVVAFLDIRPFSPGHTLVVPRLEIDQWLDAPADLLGKVTAVAQTIGLAQREAFQAPRAALMVAGFDVPHLHIHVFPAETMETILSLSSARPASDADLDSAADRLREALRSLGHGRYVP